MYSAEQLLIARRRHVETLLGLTGRTFQGVERLIDLNLRTVRSAIDDASQAALAAVSARDVPSLIAARMGRVQPAAEKAAAYGRELLDIVSSTSAEWTRVAGTASAETRQHVADAAAEAVVDAAPAFEAASQASADALSTARAATVASGEALQTAAAAAEGVAEAAAELPVSPATEAMAQPSIVVSADAPAKAQPRSRRTAA